MLKFIKLSLMQANEMLFRLSENVANLMFSLGNISLIVGSVFVLVGSILVPWSAGERDRFSDEKIVDARATASLADVKASQANERAAKLELETQHAKLETEKLKARTAWRTLTTSQQTMLQSELRSYAGRVTIAHNESDAEAAYFSVQIAAAFIDAGWTTNMQSVSLGGSLVIGTLIPPSTDANAKRVAAAFDKLGIPHFDKASMPPIVSQHGSGGLTESDVVVFVGPKPLI